MVLDCKAIAKLSVHSTTIELNVFIDGQQQRDYQKIMLRFKNLKYIFDHFIYLYTCFGLADCC